MARPRRLRSDFPCTARSCEVVRHAFTCTFRHPCSRRPSTAAGRDDRPVEHAGVFRSGRIRQRRDGASRLVRRESEPILDRSSRVGDATPSAGWDCSCGVTRTARSRHGAARPEAHGLLAPRHAHCLKVEEGLRNANKMACYVSFADRWTLQQRDQRKLFGSNFSSGSGMSATSSRRIYHNCRLSGTMAREIGSVRASLFVLVNSLFSSDTSSFTNDGCRSCRYREPRKKASPPERRSFP